MGGALGVGVGATGLRLEAPLGSTFTLFSGYSSMTVFRGLVIFRVVEARIFAVLPVELFTEADLSHMKQAIELNAR